MPSEPESSGSLNAQPSDADFSTAKDHAFSMAETVIESCSASANETLDAGQPATSHNNDVVTSANTLDAGVDAEYPAYGEESDALPIGMTLEGKYEITGLVGSGGMGSVYQARHATLNRDVAIKVMKRNFASDQEALERFQREAQLCAMIEHPNSVRVFDYGVQGNICFLVMEFLHGHTLRERLAKRMRLSLLEAVAVADCILQVLGVLHRRGIIHRDLKPDNIFFSRRPEDDAEHDAEAIKLIDFGIAKQPMTSDEKPVTRAGVIIGTPVYMSPEQCEGKTVDGRSDIYSMGVILCEMLTGRTPFAGDSALGVMYQQVNAPPPDLRELAPEVSAEVSEVVKRMLEKSPERRHQKASDAAFALREAAGVKAEDRSGRTLSPERYFGPKDKKTLTTEVQRVWISLKTRRPMAMIAASACAVALIFAGVTWQYRTLKTATLTVRYAFGYAPVSLAAALSPRQKETVEKSAGRLVAYLETEVEERRQNPNAWAMAQMTLAIGGRGRLDAKSVEKFFHAETDAQAKAWRDSPSGLPHTGVSGWVAVSLARLNHRLNVETLLFLLNNQQPDGWWLIYIGNSSQTETTAALPSLASDYASVYATSMAVLGLQEQLKLGIEDQNLAKRVENAIQLGRKWILRTRIENAARWFDYPFNDFRKQSIGLSGLALHALHRTASDADADALAELDRLWLASLPDLELDARIAEPSLVPLPMYQREDVTKHYSLQWAMIATADAYASSSGMQKAKAFMWMSRIVETLDAITSGVIGKTDWIAAEWLIALRYLQGERVI